MAKLIDEFRRGWQGISQPVAAVQHRICDPLPRIGDRWRGGGSPRSGPTCSSRRIFRRWSLRRLFGGCRIGVADRDRRGRARRQRRFRRHRRRIRRALRCWLIFWAVCGVTIWGVEHYRSIAAQQREISKRLIRGGGIPQAGGRRAAAPAEEQDIDRPRRAAPGAARPAAGLGQHRPPHPRAVGDR